MEIKRRGNLQPSPPIFTSLLSPHPSTQPSLPATSNTLLCLPVSPPSRLQQDTAPSARSGGRHGARVDLLIEIQSACYHRIGQHWPLCGALKLPGCLPWHEGVRLSRPRSPLLAGPYIYTELSSLLQHEPHTCLSSICACSCDQRTAA